MNIKRDICIVGIQFVVAMMLLATCQRQERETSSDTTKNDSIQRQERENSRNTTKNDSILNFLQKKASSGPTKEQVMGLIESVKPEREKLIQTLEKLYPGLYKRYVSSAERIIKLKEDREIRNAFKELDEVYKNSFSIAFEKSGISESYKGKIESALAGTPFTLGDLGVVTIRWSPWDMADLQFDMAQALSADSTITSTCPFDVLEKGNNCGGLYAEDIDTNADNCWLRSRNYSNSVAGGCESYARVGRNIDVNPVYINLTSTFAVDYELYAKAYAVFGGAYCEAIVGSELAEGSDVKVRTQFRKIYAVAPLIWYNEADETRTNQYFTCSYSRGSSTISSVSPKVYCEANSGSGAPVGSANVDSRITAINSLSLRMQK